VKRAKYGNIRSRCAQGKAHASKLEARRCDELHLLQRVGAITELQAHPQRRFDFHVVARERVKIGTYVADFTYLKRGTGALITVEDCKGVATPVYRLKKKLMLALYGIEVQEYPGKR
jgi:hypothetical protein